MVIIPNSRFQRETEQSETVKQSEKAVESSSSVGVEKSEDSEGAQKAKAISVRQREFDQYVPEEAGGEKSYGHYEVVSDGDGNSKVRFDDPGRNPKEKESIVPTKEKNGDSFGQEKKLQNLKKKQQQLKQKIKSETDPEKAKELKRKLAQTEQQIRAQGK